MKKNIQINLFGTLYNIDEDEKFQSIQKLLKEKKFNLLAHKLGIKMIHVNDIDLQELSEDYNNDNSLYYIHHHLIILHLHYYNIA